MRLQLGYQSRLQRCQFLRGPSWNRLRENVPRLPSLFQIALDRRERDSHQLHDLRSGVALIDRPQHFFS